MILIKKTVLLGLVIFAASILGTLANASQSDLGIQTVSTIDEPTSLSYPDASRFIPGCPTNQVTNPKGKLFIAIEDIRKHCGFKKSGICQVDLFASNNCGGAKIGNFSIDLATAHVTVNYTVGPYKPTASESTLYINYWS